MIEIVSAGEDDSTTTLDMGLRTGAGWVLVH